MKYIITEEQQKTILNKSDWKEGGFISIKGKDYIRDLL